MWQVKEKTNAGARDWSMHVGRTFCKACFMYFASRGSFAGRQSAVAGGSRRDKAPAEESKKVQESDDDDADDDEEEEEDERGRGGSKREEEAGEEDTEELDEDEGAVGQTKRASMPKIPQGAAGGDADSGGKNKGSGAWHACTHVCMRAALTCPRACECSAGTGLAPAGVGC